MDQIRANTPAPIKANLMTEQLSVQMSWGNGGCTRAGSPGDQQPRELGPWATRRSRAMMRANAWGHDELMHLEKTNLPRLETLIKAYGAATIRATGINHMFSLRHWATSKFKIKYVNGYLNLWYLGKNGNG